MNKKILVCLSLLFSLTMLPAGSLQLSPDRCVILLGEKSDRKTRHAAEELQRHFALMTGQTVPILSGSQLPEGKYPFLVGANPGRTKLEAEEGRWQTTAEQTVIFGDEKYNGTLFAVYDFLEKQFKIRWLAPGELWTVCPEEKTLNFSEGAGGWKPGQLKKRGLRGPYRLQYYARHARPGCPEKFRMTDKEYETYRSQTYTWLACQRMGTTVPLYIGHAFTRWYEKYHKDHPEYFALQKDGKRGYGDKPSYVKLCVGNPAVAEQVVSDWSRRKTPQVNTCENDGGFFCTCPLCTALDVRYPGEKLEDHITDRYLNFSSRVLNLARKIRPDVKATMYAYAYYRFPPRRERVHPDLILGFVPSMLEMSDAEKMYDGWRKAGAKMMFLRPNDHHLNCGLPLGFEKTMFESFQLGIRKGIFGTDYDSLHNFWPVTGIADYILARGHVDPSQSFEHWENEYYSAFGAAKDHMAEFFRYWRQNVWEKRMYPNRRQIQQLGINDDFRRGILWYLDRYYRLSDFDATDRILQKALQCRLTPREKARIQEIALANRHSRLLYQASVADGDQKLTLGRELYQFRIANRNRMQMNWNTLFHIEKTYGDKPGTNTAAVYSQFEKYQPLARRLSWRFKLDPDDAGLKEKWFESAPGLIDTVWEPIMTDRPWETQYRDTHPALIRQLKTYDGIGWYGINAKINPGWKKDKIYIYFGAVDESAWLWINGKPAGERICRPGSDDWKTPFYLRIDQHIDWNRSSQCIIVRVKDTGGQGGIWKPVALVVKNK